jgi:hypothetical protein
LIDQEKNLGGDFARLNSNLNDMKQRFLTAVKQQKDAVKSGRIFSWHELQNELQLTINQRAR